jgi:rubredoxin
VQKVLRSGTRLRCIADGCGYAADPEDGDPEANVKAS